MEAMAIVFIVLVSVLFTACNLLCCLCAGRGGRDRTKKSTNIKKGTKKTTTSIGSRATRDGNMVIFVGAPAGTATTSGVMTSGDKRNSDNKGGNSNISGGSGVGVGVGGSGGGTDNSGTNHGCCCGGAGGCNGGCGGGCGGCGG